MERYELSSYTMDFMDRLHRRSRINDELLRYVTGDDSSVWANQIMPIFGYRYDVYTFSWVTDQCLVEEEMRGK